MIKHLQKIRHFRQKLLKKLLLFRVIWVAIKAYLIILKKLNLINQINFNFFSQFWYKVPVFTGLYPKNTFFPM